MTDHWNQWKSVKYVYYVCNKRILDYSCASMVTLLHWKARNTQLFLNRFSPRREPLARSTMRAHHAASHSSSRGGLAARVNPHTGIPADSQSNPCRPRRPIVEIPRKHNNLHPEHLSWPDVTISHFKDLGVIPFCERERLCDSSRSRSDALCG